MLAWQVRVKPGSEAGSMYGGSVCLGSSSGRPKSMWRWPRAWGRVIGEVVRW